jgi:hypothetical protein
MNSIGEVQSVSLTAGESTEDPVYPPTTYTIAANVSNGKVTATKNGTAISLPYVATEGDVIVLSVTPDEGYEFNGWLDGNKSNPRTVTMTGDVVLSASCVEIAKPTYTLSASVTNGMVSAKRNGSAVNLPFTANEGDVIVVEVTPNDGYAFEGWNDGNTDNPRSITMNADVALSAECSEVVQPPVGNYIQFEDKAVEAICVANWSSDGIGLTMEDAAAVTTIGTIFKGNTEITSFEEFQYFTKVTSLSSNAFNGCSALEYIKIPTGIAIIPYGAFQGTRLRTIESNCTLVKDSAFKNCKNLESVSLPFVVTIEQQAFNGCNLLNVAATPNVESIGTSAFYGCSALSAIDTLKVKVLGGFSLYQCASLSVLEFGGEITSVGNSAMEKCTSLQKVIVRASTPPTLGNTNAFNNTNNCPIYVPDASLEAYRTATNWNTYADRIHPLSEIEDYYVSDALLMHLDGINKGNVEGEWQDLVSGNTFLNSGAVAESNAWVFDGSSAFMYSEDIQNYPPQNRTIEIVAQFERANTTEVLYAGKHKGAAVGRYANTSEIILAMSSILVDSVKDAMTMGNRCVGASFTNNDIAASLINGIRGSVGIKQYFGGDVNNRIYLGKRSTGNHFKGKIHAIRIHDRILSEEEILYNQRIDNKRFNLGLDI